MKKPRLQPQVLCDVLREYVAREDNLENIFQEQFRSEANGKMSEIEFKTLWSQAKNVGKLEGIFSFRRSKYPVCSVTREQCERFCDKCCLKTAEGSVYNRLREYIFWSWNLTYVRDKFSCQFEVCGKTDGLLDVNSYLNITVDHLLPMRPRKEAALKWRWEDQENWFVDVLIANSPENLVCACRHCNSSKGNQLLDEAMSRDALLMMTRAERIEKAKLLCKSDMRDEFGKVTEIFENAT